MRVRSSIWVVASMLCVSAWADAPAPVMAVKKPVKVTAADAAGPVFTGKYAVKSVDGPDGPATDVIMMKSKDHRFEVGLYEAGPSESDIAAYEDDEFFFILEGAITLTSADGSVVAAKAGEGVAIPKGWKGHWSTKGYRKYYVTYETPAAK